MKLVSSPTAIKYMEEDLVKLESEISILETKKEEVAAKEPVDMATVLTYVKYFVEHIKDLLLDHCNPVLRARYFGVIFDEVPTYSEIACGTPEIRKIPGVNELFKLAHSKDVSLVRHIDLSWNTLEPSLVLMYEKLVDLGWTYYSGEIRIEELENPLA